MAAPATKKTTKKRTRRSVPSSWRDEFGLTKREREFADLYRGGGDPALRGNAQRCYMKVHPTAKENSAAVQAHRMLKRTNVDKYIKSQIKEIGKEADITEARVLREIARLGFHDVRRMFDDEGVPIPIKSLDDDTAAAIAGIKIRKERSVDGEEAATVIEYKLANKDPSLDKLSKMLGLYEADNKQKNNGLLADLPRDVVQLIVQKLSGVKS